MAALGRLRNYPGWLEVSYRFVDKLFKQLDPLIQKIGYQHVDRWLRLPERVAKQAIFDCQMCGQCTLHFSGMTCPMTCPKNLRNGPCGGVRSNRHCEVKPEMTCIWVEAFERSTRMNIYGSGFYNIQAPLNRQLEGCSAFVNILRSENDGMPQVWKLIEGESLQ
jgi:hypothetical protein